MPVLARDRLIEPKGPVPAEGVDALAADPSASAVQVDGNLAPDRLAPFLDRLTLIVIRFPAFRDGRGFTLARALREHHGFTGELRAAGALLPDQHAFLLRSGFDSVELPASHADPALWIAALGAIDIAYQAMAGDRLRTDPLGGLRHKLTDA